jgi:ABC-2 type transport system permease protein
MTNRLRAMLAIAWKEIQVRAKDRGSLVILFILPLLFGSMLGSMANQASNEEEGISIGVYLVNQDSGPYGQTVVSVLEEMSILDLEQLDDAQEADQLVADGKKLAAIIIPADLSARINAYEPTAVDVVVDPTQQDYAGIVTGLVNYAISPVVIQGELQHGIQAVLQDTGVWQQASADQQEALVAQSLGAIMTRLQALQSNPTITILTEDTEGEEDFVQNAFSVVMPGFTVAFAFWLMGVIGQTVHIEREQGSFRRLVAAPIGRFEIIGGNVLAFMAIVFLQVVVLFGVAAGVFDMPLGNQPLGLLLVTIALALAVCSLGLMLGSLTRTGKQADTLGMILGFVLAGLGGTLVVMWPPLYRSPGLLGFVSRLTPHAHALAGYHALMVEGARWTKILPEVGILLGFAAVFFGVAVARLRFD